MSNKNTTTNAPSVELTVTLQNQTVKQLQELTEKFDDEWVGGANGSRVVETLINNRYVSEFGTERIAE